MQDNLRYIDLSSLAALVGVSCRTAIAMVKRGDLPEPVKLGRLSRWHAATVERFLDDRGDPATVSFEVPIFYPDDPSKQNKLVGHLQKAVESAIRDTLLTIAKEGTEASCQSAL